MLLVSLNGIIWWPFLSSYHNEIPFNLLHVHRKITKTHSVEREGERGREGGECGGGKEGVVVRKPEQEERQKERRVIKNMLLSGGFSDLYTMGSVTAGRE